MIAVAEQMKRPVDMLMFLGEYFKKHLEETGDVDDKRRNNKSAELENFFLSPDILNSLGTACKMYIDDCRQELRIAIALARNPVFKDEDDYKPLSTLHG